MKDPKNFYCKIHSGSMESIEEWNDVRKQCDNMGLSETERRKILFPDVCKKQCESCVNEVIDSRKNTNKLIRYQEIDKLLKENKIFIKK